MNSKQNKSEASIKLSSNSITILNFCGSIHSGGELFNLDNVDISNSNLSSSNFNSVSLKNANLSNCIL